MNMARLLQQHFSEGPPMCFDRTTTESSGAGTFSAAPRTPGSTLRAAQRAAEPSNAESPRAQEQENATIWRAMQQEQEQHTLEQALREIETTRQRDTRLGASVPAEGRIYHKVPTPAAAPAPAPVALNRSGHVVDEWHLRALLLQRGQLINKLSTRVGRLRQNNRDLRRELEQSCLREQALGRELLMLHYMASR